jgi:hypothetical protein
MTTYRLGSSGLCYAPGIISWAQNGYGFKKDRAAMLRIVVEGWKVPVPAAKALLERKVSFTVEGEAVVFTV